MGVFPLDQFYDVGVSRSIYLLISREIIFKVVQPMRSRYLSVTDGQTDGILWHDRALLSIAP